MISCPHDQNAKSPVLSYLNEPVQNPRLSVTHDFTPPRVLFGASWLNGLDRESIMIASSPLSIHFSPIVHT